MFKRTSETAPAPTGFKQQENRPPTQKPPLTRTDPPVPVKSNVTPTDGVAVRNSQQTAPLKSIMKTKKSDTSSDKIVRPLNPLTQADKLETKNPLKDASLNSNNNNKVNLKGQSVSDLIDAQQQVSVLTPPSI